MTAKRIYTLAHNAADAARALTAQLASLADEVEAFTVGRWRDFPMGDYPEWWIAYPDGAIKRGELAPVLNGYMPVFVVIDGAKANTHAGALQVAGCRFARVEPPEVW